MNSRFQIIYHRFRGMALLSTCLHLQLGGLPSSELRRLQLPVVFQYKLLLTCLLLFCFGWNTLPSIFLFKLLVLNSQLQSHALLGISPCLLIITQMLLFFPSIASFTLLLLYYRYNYWHTSQFYKNSGLCSMGTLFALCFVLFLGSTIFLSPNYNLWINK